MPVGSKVDPSIYSCLACSLTVNVAGISCVSRIFGLCEAHIKEGTLIAIVTIPKERYVMNILRFILQSLLFLVIGFIDKHFKVRTNDKEYAGNDH